MDNRFAEMVGAVQLRLKDAGLKADEDVVILCSTDNYPPLVEAYFTAAVGLGADPVLLMYTAPPPFGGLSDVIVETASKADAVIDLSFKSWVYHESHDRFFRQLTANGGRSIDGHTYGWEEDVFHLLRLTPSADVKERTRRAQSLIDNANTIRLTSSLGTDLLVQRGDPEERLSYAPAGQVAFAPPDDGVDGVVYYQGGFRIQYPEVIRRMVYQPTRMEVENGKLVEIARDAEIGIMLDDWFRSHDDPNSYQFAHINLGLDPRIRLDRLDNIAVHFNYGATLIAFGINYTPLFGSGVIAKSHIDMNYTGGDYWVDDLCLVRNGEFTDESGLRGPFTD
jgi:leucyl aminopeptidase (aminopeptidase T)